MGAKEANRHEEWFVKILLERFGRAVCQLEVSHLGVRLRIRPPIPRAAPVRGTVHRFFGPGTSLSAKGPVNRTG